MQRKPRWGKWVAFLIILAGAAGGTAWYLKSNHDAAPDYQTATVTRGDLTQVVTATGQLDPVINVQVGSQISGTIQKLLVDYNSMVKSNQVIAQIEPSSYQVAVLKAEADLANAQASLNLNAVQAHREEMLYTNKLVSASDYDTAEAQLVQAQAQVKSSEAALASAKVDLSRCTIYAPVDGVVISRNVDVGQTVAASFNTPTLFVIANDLTKMQIDALVSEADVGGVQLGQNVNFGVDAYPYRVFHGKVTQIRYGAITNQNVVNYDTVISVDNADMKLLPGMTANVSIITAQRENAVRLPNAALRFHPPEPGGGDKRTNLFAQAAAPAGKTPATGAGQTKPGGPGGPGSGGASAGARPADPHPADKPSVRTVYVLDAAKNPQRPELKPVKIKTGINDGANTEVLEGLNDGDQVVIGILTPQTDAAAHPNNPFSGGRRF
jgi:HlyD family secretion protein